MKSRLDEEVEVFEGIVKVVRMPERKGLMVARTKGAEHATGDVSTANFHCLPVSAPVYVGFPRFKQLSRCFRWLCF